MPTPTFTTPPTAPSTTNPSTFDTLADAFIAWFSTHVSEITAAIAWIVTQLSTMSGYVAAAAQSVTDAGNNAAAAASSAGAAATSASLTIWISGTSYTAGTSKVLDPTNWQPYVRKVSGAGTTVPSSDPTNWQPMGAFYGVGSSIKTANYTAVAGDNFPHNTTAGAFTVTLPASPLVTDPPILIMDVAGTFGLNALTLGRNGNKIMGVAEDCVLDLPYFSSRLVWTGATYGWTFL